MTSKGDKPLSDEDRRPGEAYGRGDDGALEGLLKVHGHPLKAAALRLCGGDEADASDALQELSVRLTLPAVREQFDAARPWLPWAKGILRRCALLQWRKQRRHIVGREPLNEATIASRAAEFTVITDTKEEINRFVAAFEICFDSLKEFEQKLFILHVLKGMSFREMSELLELGTDANHTSNPYYAARKALQNCLRRKGFES